MNPATDGVTGPCSPGYFLYPGTQQCDMCPFGYTSKGGNETECQYCKDGYGESYILGECQLCQRGYYSKGYKAEDAKPCQRCPDDMIGNLIKDGCMYAEQCVGQYVENDISDGIGQCACTNRTAIALNRSTCVPVKECGNNTIMWADQYYTVGNNYAMCICKTNNYVVSLEQRDCIPRTSCDQDQYMTIVDGKCQCMAGYVISLNKASCISRTDCENSPDALIDDQNQRCVCNSDSTFDGTQCTLINPNVDPSNNNTDNQDQKSVFSSNEVIVVATIGAIILAIIIGVMGVLLYRHIKQKRISRELYKNFTDVIPE